MLQSVFFPNRLLEVITGETTSAETAQFLWQFGGVIGKTCIRVEDRPGFAINRFFVPWLIEAVRLFEAGEASIPTIEAAAKRAFEIGMGPFELMNVTGVAIAYHAAESLKCELGSFYAPPGLLEKQAADRQNWDLEGEADPDGFDAVSERLLGCVFAVSTMLVEEGVASRPRRSPGAGARC